MEVQEKWEYENPNDTEDIPLEVPNEAVANWLREKRRPLQPYTDKQKVEGYSKDDWIMREISRLNQIDELLKELGTDKFGRWK